MRQYLHHQSQEILQSKARNIASEYSEKECVVQTNKRHESMARITAIWEIQFAPELGGKCELWMPPLNSLNSDGSTTAKKSVRTDFFAALFSLLREDLWSDWARFFFTSSQHHVVFAITFSK